MGRRRRGQAQFRAERITLTLPKTRQGYARKPLQGIRIYLAGVLRRRLMGLIRHDLVPMLITASLRPWRACRAYQGDGAIPGHRDAVPLGLYAAS